MTPEALRCIATVQAAKRLTIPQLVAEGWTLRYYEYFDTVTAERGDQTPPNELWFELDYPQKAQAKAFFNSSVFVP